MTQFTENEWAEFKLEVLELLDAGEQSLLAMARGASFSAHYDTLFRAFHNIKGVAAMVQLIALRDHVHQLENILTARKSDPQLPKEYVTFFLKGVDGARRLLNNETISFDYTVGTAKPAPAPAPMSAPSMAKVITLPVRPSVEIRRDEVDRVLIIDDSKAVLAHLSNILRSVGFDVKAMGDSVQAMNEIAHYQPNVILTDILMPGMGGNEVLKAVQGFDSELPVVFISGCVTKDSMLEAIKNGAFSSIQKPFSEQEVVQVCFSASRKHRIALKYRRAVDLLMYQYSELDDFLKASGKTEIREYIKTELKKVS